MALPCGCILKSVCPHSGKKPNRRNASPWAERARIAEENLKKAKQDRAEGKPPDQSHGYSRAKELAAIIFAQAEENKLAVIQFLMAELAKDNFAQFCQQAWHVVEPSTRLEWNWHHQLICETLQALFEDWLKTKKDKAYINAVRNTLFNLPPGSLKSRLIAVFYHPWCWLRAPGMKFICLSVNEDATLRDARAARDLIKSEWYQNSFKPEWKLKGDQDAISNYGNTKGGERLSKPSGSEVVGLRGDCVAGNTRVATELGDIAIKDIHAMPPNEWPKVWSRNFETGTLELKSILATRMIPRRETVNVCTQAGNMLQCTDDHQIYTDKGYLPAAYITGHEVSLLPGTDLQISRKTNKVRELQNYRFEMCGMPVSIPAPLGRIRETRTQKSDSGTVLQQKMQDDGMEWSGDYAELFNMRNAVPDSREKESQNLFQQMCRYQVKSVNKDISRQSVCSLPEYVYADLNPLLVLFKNLSKPGTLNKNGRNREFKLFGATSQFIRRRSLGEPCSVNTTPGRSSLHRLRGSQQLTCHSRSSYRSRPTKQSTREFNNTLRRLSYDTPQIQTTSVLSVDQAIIRGRRSKIDVYDIQVEGNHNFFANGILAHNCLLIDDPNNPLEAENKSEREKVNNLWDTNIYNRVNSGIHSLRIGVQQRTNAEDWTGHVLKKQGIWSPENPDGWLHVVLPAEFDPGRRFRMPDRLRNVIEDIFKGSKQKPVLDDPRTVEGESVHPDRYSTDFLKAERRRWEGTGNYAGQMQQLPALLEGAKIKRNWWGWCRLAGGVRPNIDDLPLGRPRPAMCHDGKPITIHQAVHKPGYWNFDWVTISVDPAAKKTEKGSNYGLLCIAGQGGRRFVLDDRTRRGAFHEIVEVIKEMIVQWKPDSILIEPKAAGPDIMDTLREQMLAGDVEMVAIEEAEPGNQDKEMRLEAAIPYIKNGAVFLLDGAEWLERFVEELSVFPFGPYDDRVDALSQCLNHRRAVDDEMPDW